MYQRLLLAITFLISSSFVFAQDDTIKDSENTAPQNNIANDVGVIKVKDSIYMLKGRGGNIGISVGRDGVFMIDDQFSEASENIKQRIRSLTDKPIQLLVNTHHHGDHSGGNSNMANAGTVIFSHQNARVHMIEAFNKMTKRERQNKIDSIVSRSGTKLSSKEEEKMAYENAEAIIDRMLSEKNIPEGALPVVSFAGGLTFNYNGEEIQAIHIPNAHTDGDVMIYFTKSNVLHTGDAFVNSMYPYIDQKNNGNIYGYAKGIDQILRHINNETIIIPGHGNLASINDVQFTQSMLRYLIDRVEFQVVSKKSEAEVVAMKELTKEYDDKGFGDGFINNEKFIKAIYTDVARKYIKK